MEAEDAASRAALLKSWALAAGFDRAGVARLGRAATGDAFVAWLDRGDQAGMAYMERRVAARLSPVELLAGARSALCVALQYGPAAAEPTGEVWPRVARYARGRDYHNLMGRRLRKLAARIRAAFPGAATRAYVDTGPVLERDLAAAAGLGAFGKNTMLLHPEAGSWFLLGEILTTLDLAPDEPLADLCGSCTRCLEACPTGALTGAYRLDSRRCISYWTIEHRGALPEAAREWLGDWLFGCDACQEACPWNASVPAAERPDFAPPPDRRDLDLASLLALGEEAYRRRFSGSPLQRAGREGLQRNAAASLGARRSTAHLAALAAALREGGPLLRRHAAWALGRLASPAAGAALRAAFEREADPEVRYAIGRALAANAPAAP